MPLHSHTRSSRQSPMRSCSGFTINAGPLTHKQDEAGPLVELHGVGLAELQHGPRVPGKEPALRVVQHLHAALSRYHVTFCVQQNQRGNTWRGRR